MSDQRVEAQRARLREHESVIMFDGHSQLLWVPADDLEAAQRESELRGTRLDAANAQLRASPRPSTPIQRLEHAVSAWAGVPVCLEHVSLDRVPGYDDCPGAAIRVQIAARG